MSFVFPVGNSLTQRGLAQSPSITILAILLLLIMLTNPLSFTNLAKVLRCPMFTKSLSFTNLAHLFTYTMGSPCTPTTRFTSKHIYVYCEDTALSHHTHGNFVADYRVYSMLYCYTFYKSDYLSCAYTSGPFCRNTVAVARRSSLEALFANTDRVNQ